MHPLLAQLPAVHVLADRAAELTGAPRWALVEAARRAIAARRAALLADEAARAQAAQAAPPTTQAAQPAGASDEPRGRGADIAPAEVAASAERLVAPSLRKVINATGVVLHTNLGRAPLAAAARRAVEDIAAGYSNLEYELGRGERGSRHDHLRPLLCALTGAEDAVVVNNNAAATVLGLAALAAGRGVVVSRGELIEIGGSFRLPEILELSGCRMIEVGTTNKTRASDYRAAVEKDGDVALFLKVHRSNFAIVGFTAEAGGAELVRLAADLASRPAVMIDLGSGALLAAELQRQAGLPAEPTVAETVASGADLVSFSGDKLLGGPQAGILVGKAAAIARARKHPLMRMLRPDKLTLAALEATLACYRDGRLDEVPALAMLRRSAASLRGEAEALAARLADGAAAAFTIEARPCTSTVGGGAMPTAQLASWALAIGHGARDASALDAALRAMDPPVVGRVEDGQLWLDLRSVLPEDRAPLEAALARLLGTAPVTT